MKHARLASALALSLLAACGTVDSPPGDPDAPAAIDAAPGLDGQGEIDAAPLYQTYRGLRASGSHTVRFDVDATGGAFLGSFEPVANAGAPITFSGAIDDLGSGFQRFTVTASSATAEVPADGQGWFLVTGVPGFLQVVSPSPAIRGSTFVTVAPDDCTSFATSYGMLFGTVERTNFFPETSSAYGTLILGGTATAISLAGTEHSLDCIPAAGACTRAGALESPPPGRCAGGALTLGAPGGPTAPGFAAGGVLTASVGGADQVVGFAQEADLLVSQVTGRGYRAQYVTPTGWQAAMVQFTGADGGLRPITNLDTGALGNILTSYHVDPTASDGQLTGTMTRNSVVTPFTGFARHFSNALAVLLISYDAGTGTPSYVFAVSAD